MKQFKIKKAIKPDVKQWCLDNLGTENVRWWIEEELVARNRDALSHQREFTFVIDVTQEEESRLMYFVLKYGQ